ncbi:MAG: hypothetical protein IPO31_10005 [Candidatus Obscuribacter sp.]|nr:hypothetical protein [Candidatus Obscuribacter sp.]
MNASTKSLKKYEHMGLRTSFAGLSLALLLALSLETNVLPVSAAISGDPRLGQLEVKFFKHSYKSDSDSARLDRLDKLVFGEVRSGTDDERLKSLADTVPNLSSVTADDADEAPASTQASGASGRTGGSGTFSGNPSSTSRTMDVEDKPTSKREPGSSVLAGESKYPAVTALEQALFSRDYSTEPVADRLNRLETKVFGKPSKFTDMSERVDALKERTRVDIAKKAPPGSDWVEDEDDDATYPQPTTPTARTDGDDGRSFSGRNLRKDMQKAFGGTTGSYGSGSYGSGSYGTGGLGSSGSSGGSGAYGMGSAGAANGSGAYGMGNSGSQRSGSGSYGGSTTPFSGSGRSASGRSSTGSGVGLIDPDDDMPPPATPRRATSSGGADAPMMGAVGISQKVASLETAVLGQNFNQDPLPARVSRLEKTVFQSAPDANADLSLPVRVSKLLEKVPIRTKPTQSPNMASKQRGSADDFDDDDMSMGSMGSMSGLGGGQIASSRNSVQRGSGGLGKIINSIGNMLGGGYGAGYAMPAGTMMRDPSTGYLIDGSGNMINPTTGMIMGRSTTYSTGMPMGMGLSTGIPVMPATGYASPYNAYPYGNALPMGGYPYNTGMPMGGYSSFNNGFSPYGIGGGGIRFGTGGFGMGGMRMGGMWP